MSGRGFSNLRCGHLDTESFGNGEVRVKDRWAEMEGDTGMMVCKKEIHASELHSCWGKDPAQLDERNRLSR